MGNVAITTQSVPANFCFDTWQNAWPKLVALLNGDLGPVGTFINAGNATPSFANQTLPWLRKDANGLPDRWYEFVNGVWVSRHAMPPGAIIMFAGTLADIDTFDGGETGVAITAYTGPMWQEYASLQARFPLGPGTLPSGLVVNVGDQSGEEKHENLLAEIPSHKHEALPAASGFMLGMPGGTTGDSKDGTLNQTGSLIYKLERATELTGGDGSVADATTPHNNMPPYTGIYFIERTARTHYRL
jgi:microcystin-dependent protein